MLGKPTCSYSVENRERKETPTFQNSEALFNFIFERDIHIGVLGWSLDVCDTYPRSELFGPDGCMERILG